MAFSRESSFFQREKVNSRAGGEVCPGYLTSAFRHLPMVVLTN